MPRHRPTAFSLLLTLTLCLAAMLCAGLALPSPAAAVETMERGGPPPPTPGWAYGPVTYNLQYESSPSPRYIVTMHIKSPANIWFRYWYKNGSGPRWYHVSSGHKTKCFPGCVSIQAFGVNLSEFGPDTSVRIPWREGQDTGKTSPVNEDDTNSQAE